MAGFRLWIGASAADVIVRLAVQMASTVVVARLLSPEEFGLATMVLGIATIMGAFIGLPFEESLTQRRRLYTAHLETALFVSMVLSIASVILAASFGPVIETLAQAPGFAMGLIVSSLLLFGQGPGAISKAITRRTCNFVELSICQAASTAIACLVAIIAAFWGWGIYALILQRLLPNALYPVLAGFFLLRRGQRLWIPIRWHPARFRELFRFSWLHLADIGVTNAGPAVLAFLVNGYFGAALLGQLNIALRIVDPLRMAVMGIGHNLAFSVLVRLQSQPRQLIVAAGDIATKVGVFVVPAFVGLAVSAPVLLPILVGPGWESAVPLSRILCLAVALSVPFRYYYSAFSALGKPEYGLIGSIVALVAMVAGFLLSEWLGGPYVAGIAFLSYEMATIMVALIYGWTLAGAGMLSVLRQLSRIWAGALIMAVLIYWTFLSKGDPILSLPYLMAIIITGIITYPIAILFVCNSCAKDLLALIRGRNVRE